jgi:uncharacterized membrane protein required for colicin V production
MLFQSINIHLIDILVIGILAFGAYKGFLNGGIVQGLDLFTLILGFIASVFLTYHFYLMLLNNGLTNADLFAALFLGGVFTASMWAAHVVQISVNKKLSEFKKTLQDRLWGLALGVIKYLLIAGVFMIIVRELDIYTHFLPKTEKIAPQNSYYKSVLGTAAYYTVVTLAPQLKFDANIPAEPQKKPPVIKPSNKLYNDNNF